MQLSQIPLKWLTPWASQNTAIFELPNTTSAGNGRASQTIGFPPETMLPPESGGVPPQGIDFNAGLYQVARITWWMMYGGPLTYDATFATNSAINGYAQGARVTSSDYLGAWLNLTDNNQVAPDTSPGTGWVPGYAYGRTALTLTNANVTLTPLQASKPVLVLSGTLTGNVSVILPAWTYEWTVINNTTGAFTVTVTTSGGSGVAVTQGGSALLYGDGTNITQAGPLQVGAATASTQAMQLGQATGRLLRTTVYNTAGTATFTSLSNTSYLEVEGVGGGGGGGGATVTTSSQVSMGSGGGAAAFARAQITSGFSGGVTVTVGAGGAANLGAAGGTGGSTSFGAIFVIPGGGGGGTTTVSSTATILQSANQGGGGGAVTFGTGVTKITAGAGQPGLNGVAVGASGFSGQGAPSVYGGGAANNAGTTGNAAFTPGSGGAGGFNGTGGAVAWAGGAGGVGLLIIKEYA